MNPSRLRQLRLIGIADASLGPWDSIEPRCIAALDAGLPALMLRDKTPAPDSSLLPAWFRIAAAVRASGALLIVNRRPDLARAIAADAIHLGKEGPSLADARAALASNPAAIIGYSAHSAAEALNAFAAGFDYATFSPIFETPGKSGKLAPLGLSALADLCKLAPGPVVALGGIDVENFQAAIESGAAGVAMIRGVFQGDPAANSRGLLG